MKLCLENPRSNNFSHNYIFYKQGKNEVDKRIYQIL